MPINISKSIQTSGAIAGALLAIGGVIVGIEGHYAKAEALQKLELRVDQKILGDRSDKIQERLWTFGDKYSDRTKAPPVVQQQWRELEKEQKEIDIKIQKILDKSQSK